MLERLIREATPEDLQENMVATYFSLRAGLVVLSMLFPLIFLIYSLFATGALAEHSISAFYGTKAPAWVRSYFVSTLSAVGAFLVMYRGFSQLENWLLKVAGTCAVLIAFVPCECWNPHTNGSWWHNSFALAFFGGMALVCELCARETITILPTAHLQDRFRRLYRAIGVALLISPGVAIVVAYSAEVPKSYVFFIEWFGVWTFSAYWFVKTLEYRLTSIEKKVVQKELRRSKGFGLVAARKSDADLIPKSRYEETLLSAKYGPNRHEQV